MDLYEWMCTWDPDLIPRASDFNIVNRPDIARPRRSLSEDMPSKQGKEGPHFRVIIHLDVVKDYTTMEDEDQEWPRIYKHKDWRMGVKDGEGRTRAAIFEGSFHADHRSDEDGDHGQNDGDRHRGKRIGAHASFS
ncbi:hypothetical protein D1007_60769 [Hordeum vulgare]|nr:hypothetical protein D1007_60769 [Hordeum vulgare]